MWEQIREVKEELSQQAKEQFGFIISPDLICFDDSRSWSLYVPGHIVGAGANKFGAYRNYNGGGIRGPIQHNGRDQDNTVELGQLFQDSLLKIEAIYNRGYEDADPWYLPTGVLM